MLCNKFSVSTCICGPLVCESRWLGEWRLMCEVSMRRPKHNSHPLLKIENIPAPGPLHAVFSVLGGFGGGSGTVSITGAVPTACAAAPNVDTESRMVAGTGAACNAVWKGGGVQCLDFVFGVRASATCSISRVAHGFDLCVPSHKGPVWGLQ